MGRHTGKRIDNHGILLEPNESTIVLRIGQDLHDAIRIEAEKDDRSVNQYLAVHLRRLVAKQLAAIHDHGRSDTCASKSI